MVNTELMKILIFSFKWKSKGIKTIKKFLEGMCSVSSKLTTAFTNNVNF